MLKGGHLPNIGFYEDQNVHEFGFSFITLLPKHDYVQKSLTNMLSIF